MGQFHEIGHDSVGYLSHPSSTQVGLQSVLSADYMRPRLSIETGYCVYSEG